MMNSYKHIKNITDKALAILLILLFSPLFILLLAIHLLGYKIFFLQKRIGFNNQVFIIFKTLTIFPGQHPIKNQIGKFLRKSSLDELPQLLNILKGEMSFIGPRPLLPEYLRYYSPTQIKRHTVKPGITGLAQVIGLNDISWDSKFRLDNLYQTKQSFALDMYILWRTLTLFLRAKRFNPSAQQFPLPFNK